MVGWHVIGSAFYLDHPILAFVFAGLLVSWLAAPGMVVTAIERTRVDVDDRRAAALLLVALTVHATARNL